MQNVCRTCLRAPKTLKPLFEDTLLVKKIETIASIKVQEDEYLPSTICEECINNINKSYNFRKVILNSDIELQERLAAIKNVQMEIEKAPDEHELSSDIPNTTEIIEIKLEVDDETTETFNFNIPVMNVPENRHAYLKMKPKTFLCDRCDFSCTDKGEWRKHKQSGHYDPGICPICGKIMRKDNLSKHLRNHTDEFKCEECGLNCRNYEALRSHLYKHKGEELHCEICAKVFYYHGDLNRHVKKHLFKPVRKRVNCSVCQKEFDQRGIKKHLRSHTGERPYLCQYCKKGFSSSNALKTHIRQHTNEKPYICEYCPMAFPQKVSLVTHIRSKHTKKENDDSGHG